MNQLSIVNGIVLTKLGRKAFFSHKSCIIAVKLPLEPHVKMVDVAKHTIRQQAIALNVYTIRACQFSMKDSNFGHAAQNEPPILQHL